MSNCYTVWCPAWGETETDAVRSASAGATHADAAEIWALEREDAKVGSVECYCELHGSIMLLVRGPGEAEPRRLRLRVVYEPTYETEPYDGEEP